MGESLAVQECPRCKAEKAYDAARDSFIDWTVCTKAEETDGLVDDLRERPAWVLAQWANDSEILER